MLVITINTIAVLEFRIVNAGNISGRNEISKNKDPARKEGKAIKEFAALHVSMLLRADGNLTPIHHLYFLGGKNL